MYTQDYCENIKQKIREIINDLLDIYAGASMEESEGIGLSVKDIEQINKIKSILEE